MLYIGLSRSLRHINLLNKVILFSIFLQFVAYRANDILNLGFEELLERFNRDLWGLLTLLLDFLLLVQNSDHLSVMIPVFVGSLTIIKIDQHVS